MDGPEADILDAFTAHSLQLEPAMHEMPLSQVADLPVTP
jgi:hypothetical protein